MSKAFTRESDTDTDDSLPVRPSSLLPPGAKNYVTPDGVTRLRSELGELVSETRPQIATSEDDEDRRRKLQQIDLRIEQLEQSLRTAVVVPVPDPEAERRTVRFGAIVTVRRRSGEATYRIVGVDETDLDRGWVSYLTPIAKALLGAGLHEHVRFRFPGGGEEEMQIVRIDYPAS